MDNGKLVYLDNAATSWPKPEGVYAAMDHFMRHVGANPGRSAHSLSIEAARTVFGAREAVARVLGITDSLRLIFTSNATHAINLALNGILSEGDRVVTTALEHNSVVRPLNALRSRGIHVSIVPASPTGELDLNAFSREVQMGARLVVTTHASNVLGAIMPLQEMADICRRHGSLFMVDAAQTAGCLDLPVEDIDLLAFSGHKGMLGPQGTGGLFIRQGLEEIITPLMFGGTGSLSSQEVQPSFMPDKYESGTPNSVGLAGLQAGANYVLREGIDRIRDHERNLASALIEGLASIPGIRVFGPREPGKRTSVVSFTVDGRQVDTVGHMLDDTYGVLCRVGLHCSPLAHKTIGTYPAGTVRLSPGYFTSLADIEYTLTAIRNIVRTAP